MNLRCADGGVERSGFYHRISHLLENDNVDHCGHLVECCLACVVEDIEEYIFAHTKEKTLSKSISAGLEETAFDAITTLVYLAGKDLTASGFTHLDWKTIYDLLLLVLRENKTVSVRITQRALWCVQSLHKPPKELEQPLELLNLVSELFPIDDLTELVLEAIDAILKLLQPSSSSSCSSVWGRTVYLGILSDDIIISQKAEEIMKSLSEIFPQTPLPLSSGLLHDLQDCASNGSLWNLFANRWQKAISTSDNGALIALLQVWGHYVRLLGQSLVDTDVAVKFITFAEESFSHLDPSIRVTTYRAWCNLVTVYGQKNGIPVQVESLMTPLSRGASSETNTAVLVECFQTWEHLCRALGSYALTHCCRDVVCHFLKALCTRTEPMDGEVFRHLMQDCGYLLSQDSLPIFPKFDHDQALHGYVPPLGSVDPMEFADLFTSFMEVLELGLCQCSFDISSGDSLLFVRLLIHHERNEVTPFERIGGRFLTGSGMQGHIFHLLSVDTKRPSFPVIGDISNRHRDDFTKLLYLYIQTFLETFPHSLAGKPQLHVCKIPGIEGERGPIMLSICLLLLDCVPRLSSVEHKLHIQSFQQVFCHLDRERASVQWFQLLLDKFTEVGKSLTFSPSLLSLEITFWSCFAFHIEYQVSKRKDIYFEKVVDEKWLSTVIVNILIVPFRLLKCSPKFPEQDFIAAAQVWGQLFSCLVKWRTARNHISNNICAGVARQIGDLLDFSSSVLLFCSQALVKIVSSLNWEKVYESKSDIEEVTALSLSLLRHTYEWLSTGNYKRDSIPHPFVLQHTLSAFKCASKLLSVLKELCNGYKIIGGSGELPLGCVQDFTPCVELWSQHPQLSEESVALSCLSLRRTLQELDKLIGNSNCSSSDSKQGHKATTTQTCKMAASHSKANDDSICVITESNPNPTGNDSVSSGTHKPRQGHKAARAHDHKLTYQTGSTQNNHSNT
ncbi:hypothetical protein Pelo_8862 [Pelomyxa schiedti]|nr:hypothetical protein Pelo_8862 [Pelomyxa schiedti]